MKIYGIQPEVTKTACKESQCFVSNSDTFLSNSYNINILMNIKILILYIVLNYLYKIK